MIYAAMTDAGMIRGSNEDSFKVIEALDGLPWIFVIADGVGGHNAGEVASHIAVEEACRYIMANKSMLADGRQTNLEHVTSQVFTHVNASIYNASNEENNLRRMATTLTLVFAYENNLFIGHVGDSRVYLIDNEGIIRITRDHSYIEELLNNGAITIEEAKNHPERNKITRAVGYEPHVKPDIYTCIAKNGSFLLMCTDGLTHMVEEEEIRKIILESAKPEEACDRLVKTANENGGKDNITVIVAKFD